MPTNFSYKIKTTPQGNIPELNSSCCQGQLPILMSKLTASCSRVICFSCPTCSGENCSLPPSLQLTLTDLKTCFSHHLETSLIFHPLIPLIAELSPVAPHFPWSAVPAAGHHIQERLSYYHMKKDHIMHLADYISLHTFHNNFCLFFWQHTVAMLSWWLAIIQRLFFCTTAVPALCPVPFCNCSADCCFGRAKISICQIHCWTYRIAVTWIY